MDATVVLGMWKRYLEEIARYKVEFAYFLVAPIIWMLPLAFTGMALAGSRYSDYFEKLTGTGDYLSYVLIGTIFFYYAMSAIWGMGNYFRWEQEIGTLESLLTTPASRVDMALGVALAEATISIAFSVVQLSIIAALFNVPFLLDRLASVFAVIVLLLATLYGLSMLFAASVLVFKDPSVILDASYGMLNVLTPLRYPTEVHPVTRVLSYLIPITYGFLAVRAIYLVGKSLFEVWPEILALAVSCAMLWWVGAFAFRKAEERIRREGSVTKF